MITTVQHVTNDGKGNGIVLTFSPWHVCYIEEWGQRLGLPRRSPSDDPTDYSAILHLVGGQQKQTNDQQLVDDIKREISKGL